MDPTLIPGDEPASLVSLTKSYPGMKGRWEVDLTGSGILVNPAGSFVSYDVVTIGSPPPVADGELLLSALREDHPDHQFLLYSGACDLLSIHDLQGDQTSSNLMKGGVRPSCLSEFSGRWGI